MRTTFLLLLVFASSLFATNVRSQVAKVSIVIKNASILQVLEAIESQTDYLFVYDKNAFDLNREVSLEVKNLPVAEVLTDVFSNTNVVYAMEGTNIMLMQKSENQQPQKSVSGKVTDSSGATLPGVSVVVKGTTIGVITDARGNYSLSGIPANSILIFSFVGMKSQEITIGNKTAINVVLVDESINLDEVVAIGYGTVKRQNLTSSVSVIRSEAIQSRPVPTLSEAFAGQLAGVRAQNTTGIPGAELQIRIRGINTINGNTNPLYVIDGIARDDMKDINPSDIASIQVLKDASASAIYGSRGANGVVLIETKQGTGKPSFNFESFYGFQNASKKMAMMSPNEYLAFYAWYRNDAWLRQGHSMKDPMSSRPASLQIPAAWYDYAKNGTDWQDAILTTAPIQNYQLSASAKNDMGSLYLSGGYFDQDGIVYGSYYKRMNFRFNGILNVSDRIKIGMTVAPSYSDQDKKATEGKELAVHHALNMTPLAAINSSTRDWGYPVGIGTIYPNPLEQLKETTDITKMSTFNTSVWGQFELMKGLSFKSQYSYDHRSSVYEYFQPGNVTYSNGFITIGNSNSSAWDDWSIQNTMVYDKTFKDQTLNVLIGQSAEAHRSFNIFANATGWPNDNVTTLNVAKTPTGATTYKTENKGVSFFGRADYGYKDKYLLKASIRYDGSSRFGSNNKWGLFPSTSVGWKINRESFLSDTKWINLLKLRAAWGKAGNDRIGDYDYMAKLTGDNASWGNAIVSGLAPSNIENQNLKWESTATTDIGIDFTGFNNRIQVNLDYYKNKTDNLLFNVPVPNTTGFSSFRTNIGSVQNEGWEIDLTTHNTTGNIKWTTQVNLSHEKNKVLDMGGVTQFISSSFDGQFITRVGGPVSQFYVYRSDGLLKTTDFDSNKKALVPIFTGQIAGNVKYIDQNNDKKIDASDLVPYGNNIPDLIYGMTNTVQWKNLELSVLCQGQIGGDVMFLGQRQLDVAAFWGPNNFSRWVRAWKPDYEAIYGAGENPIPNIPGVDMSWDGKTSLGIAGNYVVGNDDNRIYDGSFFRVKNVTLSYTLPKKILNRTLLKSATVYTSVDNLVTFDNYPGYTPETNSFGNATTQPGVDYATYPLSKKYTLGIKLTF
ncbi:MAG: TonB-dependent receptor [Prolixibacteraceae bacterium]|nr:TonB-dependent receptor [Prolixibacteraceae bacterium]